MSHKNDYSVIVFFPDGRAKKWQFVHGLNKFVESFLDKHHSDWKYMNVYNRREGTYLKRFYNGNIVPDFL
ncbi:MAG: hypothetical protein HXX18_06340 [Bacteroidetes bacterium]|nr:hypothetical protein [Bacteroidota bacterium]